MPTAVPTITGRHCQGHAIAAMRLLMFHSASHRSVCRNMQTLRCRLPFPLSLVGTAKATPSQRCGYLLEWSDALIGTRTNPPSTSITNSTDTPALGPGCGLTDSLKLFGSPRNAGPLQRRKKGVGLREEIGEVALDWMLSNVDHCPETTRRSGLLIVLIMVLSSPRVIFIRRRIAAPAETCRHSDANYRFQYHGSALPRQRLHRLSSPCATFNRRRIAASAATCRRGDGTTFKEDIKPHGGWKTSSSAERDVNDDYQVQPDGVVRQMFDFLPWNAWRPWGSELVRCLRIILKDNRTCGEKRSPVLLGRRNGQPFPRIQR